jgi:hypothetical protein
MVVPETRVRWWRCRMSRSRRAPRWRETRQGSASESPWASRTMRDFLAEGASSRGCGPRQHHRTGEPGVRVRVPSEKKSVFLPARSRKTHTCSRALVHHRQQHHHRRRLLRRMSGHGSAEARMRGRRQAMFVSGDGERSAQEKRNGSCGPREEVVGKGSGRNNMRIGILRRCRRSKSRLRGMSFFR